MENAGKKLKSIQILRAFAALVVLMSHLQKEIRRTVGYTFLDDTNIEVVGQAGVDLFFIISGFIMVYVTKDLLPTRISAVNFLIKRVFRVVPLYWILTLFTLIVSILQPSAKYHNHIELAYSVGSFLFIPFPREDDHFTPLLGVGWTLNYEMLFYVLFSLVIICKPRMRLLSMAGIFVGLSILGMFMDRSLAQPWFWTRPIILEFLMGGIIAHLFMKGITIPFSLALVVVALGLVGLQLSGELPNPTAYETRFWAWGGPSAFIVAGIVLARKSPFDYLPRRVANLAERAGDGSYSLYLIHMFIIRAITIVLAKLHLPLLLHVLVCYISVIVIALLVSDYLYRHVELGLTKLGKRFLCKEVA